MHLKLTLLLLFAAILSLTMAHSPDNSLKRADKPARLPRPTSLPARPKLTLLNREAVLHSKGPINYNHNKNIYKPVRPQVLPLSTFPPMTLPLREKREANPQGYKIQKLPYYPPPTQRPRPIWI